MLVTVDEYRHVSLEFVEVDAVRWSTIHVDVTGAASMDAIDEHALNAIVEALGHTGGRPLVCTVRLTGWTGLHADLVRADSAAQLLERLRQRFEDEPTRIWIQDVIIGTRPEIDLQERALANDVLGDVLRMSTALAGDDAALAAWIASAIEPLHGRCVDERIVEELDGEALRALLDDAALTCLDRLDR
jgi:hypothetical protein